MRINVFLVAMTLKIYITDNRKLGLSESSKFFLNNERIRDHPTVLALRDLRRTTRSDEDKETRELLDDQPDTEGSEDTNKPCPMMLVSNGPSSSIQSLLRKYRYDANGALIPSSVKYYIKMPQNSRRSAIVVPLASKSVSSPLGGFVRFYKEVPPIPPSL